MTGGYKQTNTTRGNHFAFSGCTVWCRFTDLNTSVFWQPFLYHPLCT